jgi:hypothetical protein
MFDFFKFVVSKIILMLQVQNFLHDALLMYFKAREMIWIEYNKYKIDSKTCIKHSNQCFHYFFKND